MGDWYLDGLSSGRIPIYEPSEPTTEQHAAISVYLRGRQLWRKSRTPIDRGILLVCDPGAAKYLGSKVTHKRGA